MEYFYILPSSNPFYHFINFYQYKIFIVYCLLSMQICNLYFIICIASLYLYCVSIYQNIFQLNITKKRTASVRFLFFYTFNTLSLFPHFSLQHFHLHFSEQFFLCFFLFCCSLCRNIFICHFSEQFT